MENLVSFLQTVNITINLDLKSFLFGDCKSNSDSDINLIILYAKNFIWFCKQRKTHPSMQLFGQHIKPILTTNRFMSCMIEKENEFVQRWGMLYDHFFQHDDFN